MRRSHIASAAFGALLAVTTMSSTAHSHDPATPDSSPDARGAELFEPGLDHAAAYAPVAGAIRPPLYDGLGDIGMQITTAEPLAQDYFNQGLRLIWGFNHAEAVRSFRAAQQIDPSCAMCFWGEALALGPNINESMSDAAVAPAWIAIGRSVALSEAVSDKEIALIHALQSRYGADPQTDRTALDGAWVGSIRNVTTLYPDDADILVLLADALMNLQPWDYWEADGLSYKGHGDEIVSVLERALALVPDHPAALHLYIHADTALALLERAAGVEDGIGYMEPSYWYYPVRQTLAAVLLDAGRNDEAVDAFAAAVRQSPGNGWALWGLAEAQRRAGHDATSASQRLREAWLGDFSVLELSRL